MPSSRCADVCVEKVMLPLCGMTLLRRESDRLAMDVACSYVPFGLAIKARVEEVPTTIIVDCYGLLSWRQNICTVIRSNRFKTNYQCTYLGRVMHRPFKDVRIISLN